MLPIFYIFVFKCYVKNSYKIITILKVIEIILIIFGSWIFVSVGLTYLNNVILG